MSPSIASRQLQLAGIIEQRQNDLVAPPVPTQEPIP